MVKRRLFDGVVLLWLTVRTRPIRGSADRLQLIRLPIRRDQREQSLAGARQAKNVDRFGRLVYRIIAVSLGLVAVLVVIFAFVVQQTGHASIDAAFYALGSGAIGGLGGVLAPAGLGAPVSAPQPGESQPTVPNQPPANGNN